MSAVWISPYTTALLAREPDPYRRFDVWIFSEYEHPGVEIREQTSRTCLLIGISKARFCFNCGKEF